MKKNQWLFTALLLTQMISYSGPIMEGSPLELSGYLDSVNEVIQLSAKVSEKMRAEEAVVTLMVETESINLYDALENNQKIRANLKKKLVEGDINPKKIHESKFTSAPKHGLFAKKPKSYKVNNVVSVEIESAKQMKSIAKVVDSEPLLRYISMKSAVKDVHKVDTVLISKALERVKEKAKLYADGLGVTLKPIAFSESIEEFTMPVPFESYKRNSRSFDEASNLFFEKEFTLELTVNYKVVQKK